MKRNRKLPVLRVESEEAVKELIGLLFSLLAVVEKNGRADLSWIEDFCKECFQNIHDQFPQKVFEQPSFTYYRKGEGWDCQGPTALVEAIQEQEGKLMKKARRATIEEWARNALPGDCLRAESYEYEIVCYTPGRIKWL